MQQTAALPGSPPWAAGNARVESAPALLDRKPVRARFLILGSVSPKLLPQRSESLTDSVAIVEMGGFPRPFLARMKAASAAWREDFIRTFRERDPAQLVVQVPS